MLKADRVHSTSRPITPTNTTARRSALQAVPHSERSEASECELANLCAHQAAAEGHPIAILLRLREEAADEIDRLLAFLDATEGEIDLDDDSDHEPSLGWTRSGAPGTGDDCEIDEVSA